MARLSESQSTDHRHEKSHSADSDDDTTHLQCALPGGYLYQEVRKH